MIRWRLASSRRLEQLQALNELRGAIEPQAARLAAGRASLDAGSDLVSQAARLWAAGQRGDNDEFLRLDIEFHAAVLKASGNPMFSQLHNLVTEVLTGRTEHGLMPHLPHHEALQLHVDVASAIQRGEANAAHAAMSRIVEQSTEEMGDIWSSHQRPAAPAPETATGTNAGSLRAHYRRRSPRRKVTPRCFFSGRRCPGCGIAWTPLQSSVGVVRSGW